MDSTRETKGPKPPRHIVKLVKQSGWFEPENTKLLEVAYSLPDRPCWHDAWVAHLREAPDRLDEEDEAECPRISLVREAQLKVYQEIRNSGTIPPEAGFYLVSGLAVILADDYISALKEEAGKMAAKHLQEPGLPALAEECSSRIESINFFRDNIPEEWDSIYHRLLASYGEGELASLHESDREEFEKRSDLGCTFFRPHREAETEASKEPAPEWAERLVQQVLDARVIRPDSGERNLECAWLFQRANDVDRVVIGTRPIELLGGQRDGDVVYCNAKVNIRRAQKCLVAKSIVWHLLYGGYLDITGTYEGHSVVLRFLERPDRSFPPVQRVAR